ncbi:4696_t:CDS:2, partial [Funneliformis geosporum]
INLCVGCIFESWESVDTIMEAYSKKHGFAIIKKWLIHHENGNHKSKCQQCVWNANYNCLQNSQTIVLTTFNNSHNHTLFPNTEEYLTKYQCIFNDDVFKEIQFLTEKMEIYQLLLNETEITHDASCLLKKLIQHQLDDPGCRQAWVCAFTSKIFTAGVQTTSCVEGLNNIIKCELRANSTLCDLASVLDARLESEVQ